MGVEWKREPWRKRWPWSSEADGRPSEEHRLIVKSKQLEESYKKKVMLLSEKLDLI